jgi:hypothetical protein
MIHLNKYTSCNLLGLECDVCEAAFPRALATSHNLATVRQCQVLRRAARKRGWTVASDGRDICPASHAVENEKGPAESAGRPAADPHAARPE